MEMKEKPKKSKEALYALAMLLSGMTCIFIVGSIVTASVSSQKLVEYKERIETSYQGSQKEIIKVGKVENSIFAKWPRWLMAVIAAVIGIFSFPAFSMLFFALFFRIHQKVLS